MHIIDGQSNINVEIINHQKAVINCQLEEKNDNN
jgi:hypothetical protein